MTHATGHEQTGERPRVFGWTWAAPVFGLSWLALPASVRAPIAPGDPGLQTGRSTDAAGRGPGGRLGRCPRSC